MKLNELDFYQIKTGLEVISAIDTFGKVSKCIEESPSNNVRYNTIHIQWNNGNTSIVYHTDAGTITVKE